MTSRRRTGEDAALAAYYRDIDRYPLLKPQEERQLVSRVSRGDQKATEKLVASNLRFVIHVAKGFQNQGLTLPDLINEGNLGLLTAARKFDPSKGVRFITYAVWWIRQNIKKALEVQSRSVRVPANVLNDLTQVRREQAALRHQLEREPTDCELADATDFSSKKVRHTLGATYPSVSLDTLRYEDGEVPLVETLTDEEAPPIDSPVFDKALRSEVASALETLAPRSRYILALHYGMDGQSPHTYQQIGAELGVSRERVRQLKEEALERLRQSRYGRRLATFC